MSLIDETKKKLHSEKGSSLLIALLLFFVCLILSMSVLSAAVANRVRIKGEKERNQEILSLESAIGVLTEGLGEIRYYQRKTKAGAGDWQEDESWVTVLGEFDGGKLEDKLESLMQNYLQGGSSNNEERFSIYLDGKDDKVYIRPQIEDDYYLVFYVELKRTNDSYDEVYKISYSPEFDKKYFGNYSIDETIYDAQERCHLSNNGNVREVCITWEADKYVLQRAVKRS